MREALAIVAEEGLDTMWKRHTKLAKQLWQGLAELGLEPFVTVPEDRQALHEMHDTALSRACSMQSHQDTSSWATECSAADCFMVCIRRKHQAKPHPPAEAVAQLVLQD